MLDYTDAAEAWQLKVMTQYAHVILEISVPASMTFSPGVEWHEKQ